jgi:hypothetical protein
MTHAQLTNKCKSDKAIACVNASSDRKCFYRQIASENTGYTSNKGINTFLEVLAHENHQITLRVFFWPNGYTGDEDHNNDGYKDDFDGDLYPNCFEKSQEGRDNGFDWMNTDDKYDTKFPDCAPCKSVGYKYEEAKCVQVQKNANVTTNDEQDWSFDPSGNY